MEAFKRDFDQSVDPRIAYPLTTSTWNSRRVPLIRTPEESSSDEVSEKESSSDNIMTFIPNSTVSFLFTKSLV